MRGLNLTGQRFGRLVAIRRTKSLKKKARWECLCDCGKTAIVTAAHLRHGGTTSCGCYIAEISRARLYRGGRRVIPTGYVLVECPDEFMEMASRRDRYILEHRLVMAKHLGRLLLKTETVHHKNGNRQDNRLENLELWAGRHVRGQNVEDSVAHSVELLQLYAPHLLKESEFYT